MEKTTRYAWLAHAVAVGALTGCGGEKLFLGGGGDSGCAPGTYAGVYNCNMGSDASFQVTGFDAAAFQQPASGRIAFELQGDVGGKALHIAPGSRFTSTQSGSFASVDLSGTSSSDLSGTLDCATYRLTGTLANVTFASMTLTVAEKGVGAVSADYDASASPPALVNGVIDPPPTLPGFFSTTCTWTAELQR
jgi:hypothetical protein